MPRRGCYQQLAKTTLNRSAGCGPYAMFFESIMNKNLPTRKKLRLDGYDYSNGVFFVTICSKNKENIFSKINHGGKIILNDLGTAIDNFINEIPLHYENVKIIKYVIMPNHLHILLAVNNVPLKNIIAHFKRAVSLFAGKSVWQRYFYDHIIRNDEDLFEKERYIEENPLKWKQDELFMPDDF